MFPKLCGVAFIVAGCCLGVFLGHRHHKRRPPHFRPHQPFEFLTQLPEGKLPAQYQCWHCHEPNHLPADMAPGRNILPCEHCATDNEIKLNQDQSNDWHLGHMVTVNRCAAFFD